MLGKGPGPSALSQIKLRPVWLAFRGVFLSRAPGRARSRWAPDASHDIRKQDALAVEFELSR